MDDFGKRNSSDAARSAEIKMNENLTRTLNELAKNKALTKQDRATLLRTIKENEKKGKTLIAKRNASKAATARASKAATARASKAATARASKAAAATEKKAATASKAATARKAATASKYEVEAPTLRLSSLSLSAASLPKRETQRKSLGQRFKNWFTRKNKRALSGIVEEGPTYKYNNPLRRENAAKTLQNFYKAHSRRSKAIYLNRFCKNPGVCMALGIHVEEIKKHFGGFTDFKYAQPPLLLIGAASANGFINEIKYVNDKTITNLRNTRRATATASATAKARATAKALGSPSSPYRTADYVAYAVLKTAKDKHKDSPLYEYLVGQFINKVNKHYPCFIETYGYYIYNTDAYKDFKNKDVLKTKKDYEEVEEELKVYEENIKEYKSKRKAIPDDYLEEYEYLKEASINFNEIMNKLKNELTLQPPITDQPSLETAIDDSCKPNNTLAILIQHLKNVQTLHDFMHSLPKDTLNPDDLYQQSEVIFLFYQIYFPLAQLSTQFTHNDLHMSNVLLYEPDDDIKYIEYHYHISAPVSKAHGSKAHGSKAHGSKAHGSKAHGSKAPREEVIVRFKSRFMAKVIDYGRAFFYENETQNSSKVYDAVCKSKNCTPGNPSFKAGKPNDKLCGLDTGFRKYLSHGKNDPSSNYRSSRYGNMSSDLRLLNAFTHDDYLEKFSTTEMTDLTDLFDRVEYYSERGAKEMTPEDKEKEENAKKILPDNIYNIIDAERELRILALNPKYIELNDEMYYGYEQLGELHIYMDGREMKYIETSISEA